MATQIGCRHRADTLSPREQRTVAIHEAGHALVAMNCLHADPVAMVTIRPAGRSPRVTRPLPIDDRHLYPESYLRDALAIRLGGRAAEVLILGETSAAAADDLAGATELAVRMVRDLGFSADLGPVGCGGGESAQLAVQPDGHRPAAEKTQFLIDRHVGRILTGASERAQVLLAERIPILRAIIELLLEEETVSGDDLKEVVRMSIAIGGALARTR